MSGPRSFKISDKSSITVPPYAVKDWTDTTMLVFDFTSWLGPDQLIALASDVQFQTNPQNQGGVWMPYPACCCGPSEDPLPDDVNPLTLEAMSILPGGKKVEMSLGAGTPGLAYLASFFASATPYARRKEVGVIMACFAMRPYTGTVLPPPPVVYLVTGSIALPDNCRGSVNVNNATAGPITVTLPANPQLDQSLRFKDVAGNATTYPVVIRPSSGTIDGFPNYSLVANYMSVEFYWMGNAWGTR